MVLKEQKPHLPYEAAMPFRNMDTKEKDINSLVRDLHTHIVDSPVPRTTKIRDQPSWPTVDKLVNKIWQIYKVECFSTIK